MPIQRHRMQPADRLRRLWRAAVLRRRDLSNRHFAASQDRRSPLVRIGGSSRVAPSYCKTLSHR